MVVPGAGTRWLAPMCGSEGTGGAVCAGVDVVVAFVVGVVGRTGAETVRVVVVV
ncbi:MAG: hypothetical protein WAL38_26930 [Solirubrobacteraceae bacterium]